MSTLITLPQVSKWLPKRPQTGHKGSFGRVLVVAGSRSLCGAGFLCSQSALSVGAGLVYWALPQSMQPSFAAALPEVITLPLPENANGEIDESAWEKFPEICEKLNPSLAVVGPGMGQSPLLPVLLKNLSLPMVVDADALNALARIAGWTQQWPAERPAIFTPHPAELARLLNSKVAIDAATRQAQVMELARLTGSVCLAKGSHTLICAQQTLFENTTGGPALAKGGSGDVLSGMIAGLWAQRGIAEGFSTQTALQTALCGVYLHGLAGDLATQSLGEYSVLARNIISCIPQAFKCIKERT